MLSVPKKSSVAEDSIRTKSDHIKKKHYFCFLCNGKSDDKGIPLLVSQTTFSRICLGEKLQEILGEKFIVLITSKDAVCWACARYINWIDRCDRKIDVARSNILSMVITKYKNAEMNIGSISGQAETNKFQNERTPSYRQLSQDSINSRRSSQLLTNLRRSNQDPVDFRKNSQDLINFPRVSQVPKIYHPGTSSNFVGGYSEKIKEDKKKHYECPICLKIFASPAALGVHKARLHPIQHICDYCGVGLSTEAKYRAHVAKHLAKTVPVVDKMLNCVSCGFQTRNMEAYCRHACDSKMVSLVCSSCRKRYVHKSSSSVQGKNLCPDCDGREGGDHNDQAIAPPSPHLIKRVSKIKEEPKGQSQEDPLDDIDLAMEVEEEPAGVRVELLEPKSEMVVINPEDAKSDLIAVVGSDNLVGEALDDEGHFEDTSAPTDVDENQGETISTDLHHEMPEFFRPPQEKRLSDQSASETAEEFIEIIENENEGEIILPVDCGSLLKCTNCEEEFEISQVATHPCFISGDVMEYSEVENESEYAPVTVYNDGQEQSEMLDSNSVELIHREKRGGNRRRIPKIPAQENALYSHLAEPETKMHCKTCYAEFRTIGLMRQHWDLTGHSREVSTTTIELNKIKDKNNKTEQTFKVVKQNFNIRANVVGQNDEDIRRTDEAMSNCIIKVKESPTIEEFMLRRHGKMCNACGVIFGDAELLAEHHCSNCLTCVTCHITFMDNKLLKKHYQYTGHATKLFKKSEESTEDSQIVEHQVIDPYYCPKCNKFFQARLALSKHLKTHYKGTNGGACHYCLLEFDDKSLIQQHVLEAHGAYLYKCEHCDRAFLTKSVRNKHQLKHVIHVCKVCQIQFKNQRLLLVHMDKVHRSKACRICGKMITDLYALRRHERRHFYDTGLKCDFCEKSFRNKASLRSHNRTHDREALFRCKICHMGFKSPRSLEDHEIVHFKKQYVCSKCSTVCPSKNFYWMHMKMHENAYKCGVCGRLYRDTSLLAIHKRKHFRARPYQCPKCPRVFSVPATLRRHLTVHTRTYPYKCGLCKKGFLTKYAYLKHLGTVHALQNAQPRRLINRIPSLPLNATDEDILQAADTLISDDAIMFNEYQKDVTIVEHVPSSDMITEEVVVETTELFDEILH